VGQYLVQAPEAVQEFDKLSWAVRMHAARSRHHLVGLPRAFSSIDLHRCGIVILCYNKLQDMGDGSAIWRASRAVGGEIRK
jgi:hypothetical protein